MKAGWLIRLLIRLYPAEFRRRFGPALQQFHSERSRAGVTLRGWLAIVWDHVRSAASEHGRVALERRRGAGGAAVSSVLQDVRFALRTLARRRVFALAVVLTIALGAGANTAIFSVVHGVLLRPLPYPDAERVVGFGHEPPLWLASQPEYLDYRDGLRSFATLAAFTQGEGNLAAEQEPERIALASVTLNFFAALGVRPRLGRVFGEGEDLVSPADVVIISHALWQRQFGGDPDVTGRTLLLNGRARTVIGVMPPNFDYPSQSTDMWLPLRRMRPDSLDHRANHYLFLIGRLRPGVPVDGARREARAFAERMLQEHADSYDPKHPPTPVLTPVAEALLGSARPYLWALFGAVGFMLLIVAANVANLLLARGEGRRREMALRGALGASRTRLATQLLAESLLLSLSGGALGVLLAWAAQRTLLALAPAAVPRLDEIGLSTPVLGYALAVSVVTGLLFGVLPALRISHEAPAEMLKQWGRAQLQGSSRRMRQSLVVAEVALAVVMLTGAGMLLRSLVNLHSAPLGFEPRSVLTAKVSLTPSQYDDARATDFYAQLLARMRALPAVAAAGAAGWLPVVEAGGLLGVLAEGQTYDRISGGPAAVPQQVTPGYFAAMGIPLLRGRAFTDNDRAHQPLVAVVSQAMARQLWPDADPLGRRFRLGGDTVLVTVVGMVGDIRARGFDDTPEPTMYFPYAQTAVSAYFMPRSMSVVIRTDRDPMRLAGSVRAIVRTLDPAVPVSSVRTLEQVVGTAVASRRFSTTLITAFATLALLLAGIGIFGVVSYGVSERTWEIGVRVALGAERRRILTLVIAESARMAAAGLLLGLAGALAVARSIRSILFDVPVVDVPTFISVGITLAAVVLVATVLPARRATAVDPTQALRGG